MYIVKIAFLKKHALINVNEAIKLCGFYNP